MSVLFVLIRLCIKSHLLSLSIVTNLFHSLLNAFQCCSFLYLIHFLSLFFMILLWFFRSSSYQGFLCLLAIVFVVAGAILSIILSILLLSCSVALSSVVLSRMGMLLNCEAVSSVNFCKVLFSSFGLGLVCRVSSVMKL